MSINLHKLVRDQFGPPARDHLGSLLGQSADSLRSGIDDSIGAVLDGLSTVAQDGVGRQKLYDAVRYCDETVVEKPAVLFQDRENYGEVLREGGNHLAGLVGTTEKQAMIDRLKSGSNVQGTDAENLLGYVTPGVLAVLKKQIEKGVVLDNPDGIGQLFLGEGDIKNVPAAQRSSGHNTGHSQTTDGYGAAAMNEGSDNSWIFRYALPAVLMGGLMLAGLNNCGNRAGKKVIALQDSEHQLALDGLRAEVEGANGKILSLQSEYDVTKSQAAELAAKSDGLTVELEAAKANIETLEGSVEASKAEVAARQAELEAAMAEIEAANAESAALSAREQEVAAELEAAKANIVKLEGVVETARADLERANTESETLNSRVEEVTAELKAARDLPTDTAQLQTLLSSVTSERDTSIDASGALQAELDKALAQKQAAEEQGVRLQADLDAALAQAQANEGALANLETTRAELEEMTLGRDDAVARNVELKTSQAELQARLDLASAEVEKQQQQLASAASLRTALEQRITDARQELESEKSAREVEVNSLSADTANMQTRISSLLGMRDQAVNTLSLRDGEVSSLGERVVTLEGQLVTLQDANEQARLEAEELASRIQVLNGELQTTQASVDDTKATLATTEETLVSANTDLDAARARIAEVSEERDQLLLKRDALASRVEELMVEKDTAIGETVQLNEQIGSLNAEIEAARVADAESQNKFSLLTESFGGLQKELGIVTGARDEASSQAVQLRTEVNGLKKEVTRLEGELSEAQTTHEKALATMQSDIEAVKAEHEDVLAGMLAEKDAVQAEFDSVRSELTTEIGSLEGQRDDALVKIEQANADLAALNEEKANAQAMIEEMQKQSESLQASLQKEQTSVSSLQAAVSTLESTKMSLTQARDDSNDQVTRLNAEIASLQDSLQKEQGAVSQLNALVADLEGTRDAVITERDKANSDIAMLESKLQESGNEIGSLTSARDGLQNQISQAAAIAQAKVDQTLSVRSEIEAKLRAVGLTDTSVESIEDDSAVSIVLGSGDLYGVGSASLSPQGTDIMSTVGAIVSEHPEWRVDVEGHTDSQGIGAALRKVYPTNWELSSARAAAVVRYLNAKTGIDAEKMSARGYGETRPLAGNDSAQGREKNRRVELVLRR